MKFDRDSKMEETTQSQTQFLYSLFIYLFIYTYILKKNRGWELGVIGLAGSPLNDELQKIELVNPNPQLVVG